MTVKDLSRFARNYSDAGSLIDNLFVQMSVRFISLAENVDSYCDPDSVSSIIVPITNFIKTGKTGKSAERAELANGVDNEHPALVAFMKYQNIETLNREILIELVDHIKVYENGNISVKFKFSDELCRIAEYIEINTTQNPAAAG